MAMINRTIAPEIKNAVDFTFSLKPIEKWTLDNGVEVYALNAGEEEVVQLEWVFFAGNSHEPKNMVASATNFMLKNGTSTRNAFEINEHFEFYIFKSDITERIERHYIENDLIHIFKEICGSIINEFVPFKVKMKKLLTFS